MCKILTVTGPTSRSRVLALLERIAWSFAKSQRDGFGFLALDKDGVGAWGRYYDTYPGWKTGHEEKSNFKIEKGEIPAQVWTLLIHGRTSTNVVGVDYCHPYRNEGNYLIHNGVLFYVGDECHEPQHPNDSAALLEWLVTQGHPAPNLWRKSWAGYGAVFIQRPEEPLMLVKCATASLHYAKRRFGGWVFATDTDDIPTDMVKHPKRRPYRAARGVVQFDREGEIETVSPFSGFAARRWDLLCELSSKK